MIKNKKLFFGLLGLLVILPVFGMVFSGCASSKSFVIDQSVPADQCALITLEDDFLLYISQVNGEFVIPMPASQKELAAWVREQKKVRSIRIPAGTHELEILFLAINQRNGTSVSKTLTGQGTFEARKKYEVRPNAITKTMADAENVTGVVFTEGK